MRPPHPAPFSPPFPENTDTQDVVRASGPAQISEPLAPPGLLGQIDQSGYEKLLQAVDEHHARPPNPRGNPHLNGPPPVVEMETRGRPGPKHIPGPLRATFLRNRVIQNYLQEGIYQLHCRGIKQEDGKYHRRSLADAAKELGYSYKHVVMVFRQMKARAFDAEGAQEVTGGVREFLNHHLEKAIEESAQRLKDNAAYGAVLIRAVEAFKELNGLDSSEDRNLNVEELAERVKGRSPLLLEVVKHSADAKKKTDQAAVDGDAD